MPDPFFRASESVSVSIARVSISSLAAGGVFAWPAWLRVLAVLPACALLWLGVAWAAR